MSVNGNHCQGTFWRYRKNQFINSKGELVWTERVSYLKGKSCEGSCHPHHYNCESDWLKGELSEGLAEGNMLPTVPEDAYDGCLLVLKYSISDPEYGLCDLWFEVAKEYER